jgi:hypothetical protein
MVPAFDTRLPTDEELTALPQVQMTSELPWDPRAQHFTIAEKQASISSSTHPLHAIAALRYASRGYHATFATGPIESRHIHATQQHMMPAELMMASTPRTISAILFETATPLESRECFSIIGTCPLTSLRTGTQASQLPGTGKAGVSSSVSAISTIIKQSVLTAKELSNKWSIGLEAAAAMIRYAQRNVDAER